MINNVAVDRPRICATAFDSGDVVVRTHVFSGFRSYGHKLQETIEELGTITDIKYKMDSKGLWHVEMDAVLLSSRNDKFSELANAISMYMGSVDISMTAQNEYGGATQLKFRHVSNITVSGEISAATDDMLVEKLSFQAGRVDHWVPVNVWDKEKEKNV